MKTDTENTHRRMDFRIVQQLEESKESQMTSDAKSYERSQWWAWKSDTEIRAKLVLVEGKNRELCVEASERMADLADTASGLADKCIAANKQLSDMAKLLQAELDRANRQVAELRKQRKAGAAVDAELAYAEGLADGIRSAMCFGRLEEGGTNKTCEGCFLVNPESCPRDESQQTAKCILSAQQQLSPNAISGGNLNS